MQAEIDRMGRMTAYHENGGFFRSTEEAAIFKDKLIKLKENLPVTANRVIEQASKLNPNIANQLNNLDPKYRGDVINSLSREPLETDFGKQLVKRSGSKGYFLTKIYNHGDTVSFTVYDTVKQQTVAAGTFGREEIKALSAVEKSIKGVAKDVLAEKPTPPFSWKGLGINLVKGGLFTWGLSGVEGEHNRQAQLALERAKKERENAQVQGYQQYIIQVPVTIGDGTFFGGNKIVPRYNEQQLRSFLEENGVPYNPKYNQNDPHRLYTRQYSSGAGGGEFKFKPNIP